MNLKRLLFVVQKKTTRQAAKQLIMAQTTVHTIMRSHLKYESLQVPVYVTCFTAKDKEDRSAFTCNVSSELQELQTKCLQSKTCLVTKPPPIRACCLLDTFRSGWATIRVKRLKLHGTAPSLTSLFFCWTRSVLQELLIPIPSWKNRVLTTCH